MLDCEGRVALARQVEKVKELPRPLPINVGPNVRHDQARLGDGTEAESIELMSDRGPRHRGDPELVLHQHLGGAVGGCEG